MQWLYQLFCCHKWARRRLGGKWYRVQIGSDFSSGYPGDFKMWTQKVYPINQILETEEYFVK